MAVKAWQPLFKEGRCDLVVRTDSMSAAGALYKGRSQVTAINAMARELAYVDVVMDADLALLIRHVAGRRNEWADALSRLGQPGSGARVPPPLLALPRRPADGCRLADWVTRGLPQGPGAEQEAPEEAEEKREGVREQKEGGEMVQ